MKLIKNNHGQTLIEALAALAFATIIVAAIAMAIVTSLSDAAFSKNQNLATQYAQEGMDIMRQKAETDINYFTSLKSDSIGIYCLAKNSTDLGSVQSDCGTTANIYDTDHTFNLLRSISLDNGAGCGGSGRKVTVTVSWSDGKCGSSNLFCHNVVLDSCITQLKVYPAP